MAKFTNISNGPRGIHTIEGLVMVDAGETVEVDLAKGEVVSDEWFATPGSKAAREAAKADDTE